MNPPAPVTTIVFSFIESASIVDRNFRIAARSQLVQPLITKFKSRTVRQALIVCRLITVKVSSRTLQVLYVSVIPKIRQLHYILARLLNAQVKINFLARKLEPFVKPNFIANIEHVASERKNTALNERHVMPTHTRHSDHAHVSVVERHVKRLQPSMPMKNQIIITNQNTFANRHSKRGIPGLS